jgi:hypothetical protein
MITSFRIVMDEEQARFHPPLMEKWFCPPETGYNNSQKRVVNRYDFDSWHRQPPVPTLSLIAL